jgi:hypothetical protein
MIPMNRETILTVATVICVLGILFLFKELNKTKEEMNNFKNFSAQVVRHLSPPPAKAMPTPEPEAEEEPVPEEEPDKSEE